MCYTIYREKERTLRLERIVIFMLTREEYYEMIANTIKDPEDFMRLFGCEHIDPQNMDYDFNRDVKWTATLEWGYEDMLLSYD